MLAEKNSKNNIAHKFTFAYIVVELIMLYRKDEKVPKAKRNKYDSNLMELLSKCEEIKKEVDAHYKAEMNRMFGFSGTSSDLPNSSTFPSMTTPSQSLTGSTLTGLTGYTLTHPNQKPHFPVIATDRFESEDPSELSFQEGEIITCISKKDSKIGWWRGKKGNGDVGRFLSILVKPHISIQPPTVVIEDTSITTLSLDDGISCSSSNINKESEDEMKGHLKICQLCLDKEVDCAYYPCGHNNACFECAKEFRERKKKIVCPFCNNEAKDFIKLYN